MRCAICLSDSTYGTHTYADRNDARFDSVKHAHCETCEHKVATYMWLWLEE